MAGAPSIGARVAVTTTKGDVIEGVVFTVDDKVMVVEQFDPRVSDRKGNYRVLLRPSVSKWEELKPPPPRADDFEYQDMPDVNRETINKRFERNVEKQKANATKINTKVTMRSQMIFDKLCAQLPCDWLEKADLQCILVMDAVLIQPPYGPDNCIGDPKEKKITERVQMVLGQIVNKIIEAEIAALAIS